MEYLMIGLGFILVLYLIGSNLSQSQQKKVAKNKEQTELKILLQTFIIATKTLFPNSQIKLLHDRSAVIESPLSNQENKKIGLIEITSSRSLKYTTNEPYYLLIIRVQIDNRVFEERENFVEDLPNTITATLEAMRTKIFSNQELQKRILATTY